MTKSRTLADVLADVGYVIYIVTTIIVTTFSDLSSEDSIFRTAVLISLMLIYNRCTLAREDASCPQSF